MRTEDVHPRVTLIKSSNPHLAGGEKTILLITSSCSSVVQLLPSFLAPISRLSCSLDADNFC